jgi:hypothetical protein
VLTGLPAPFPAVDSIIAAARKRARLRRFGVSLLAAAAIGAALILGGRPSGGPGQGLAGQGHAAKPPPAGRRPVTPLVVPGSALGVVQSGCRGKLFRDSLSSPLATVQVCFVSPEQTARR